MKDTNYDMMRVWAILVILVMTMLSVIWRVMKAEQQENEE